MLRIGRRHCLLGGLGGIGFATVGLPFAPRSLSIDQSSAASVPRELVVGDVLDDVTTLDPNEVGELSAILALNQVYQPLIGYNVEDPSKLFGVLAESWIISENGRTFTFRMNQRAKFASGNPVTAVDAAFSLQRVIRGKGRMAFVIGQFGLTPKNVSDRIRALDDGQLSITTEEAFAPSFLLYCLTSYIAAIVDSKVVLAHEANEDLGNSWLRIGGSAGSGPFSIESWAANDRIILARNTNYWGEAPPLDRIVLRHLPESSEQLMLLQSGELDVANKLGRAEREKAATDPDIKIVTGTSGTIFYAGLNVRHPLLGKPEVWNALKYLVDYDGIANSFGQGTLEIHQTLLPRGFLGAISDRPFKYEPDTAKALLAKAGVPDQTEFGMVVWNTSPYIDLAKSLQTSMAKGGVKLKLELVDGKVWLDRYLKRDVDIWLGLWGPDYPDPHSNARALAINAQWSPDKSDGPIDRFGWQADAISKRAMDALRERDPDRRRTIYEEVQREHLRASPFIFGFQELRAVAMRKSVTDLKLGAVFTDDRYWTTTK